MIERMYKQEEYEEHLKFGTDHQKKVDKNKKYGKELCALSISFLKLYIKI